MSTPREINSTATELSELLAHMAEKERAHHERKAAAAEALRNLTHDPNIPGKWAAKLAERHDGTTAGKEH